MDTKTLTLGSLTTAFLLLALVPGSMGGAAPDESAEYSNGPLGDVTWQTPMCAPMLAQVCFSVPAGETTATITIDDDSGLPVSFWVDGADTGCGSLTLSGLAPGSILHVTTNGPAYAALECGSTTATTGTITVSYS